MTKGKKALNIVKSLAKELGFCVIENKIVFGLCSLDEYNKRPVTNERFNEYKKQLKLLMDYLNVEFKELPETPAQLRVVKKK